MNSYNVKTPLEFNLIWITDPFEWCRLLALCTCSYGQKSLGSNLIGRFMTVIGDDSSATRRHAVREAGE
jgi:hypothetical protein